MMTKQPLLRVALAAATALAAGSVAAATPARIDLVRTGHVNLADGYSAQHLLDLDVRGENGESIGEIDDLAIGADGTVTGVIVESQGFLEMGDTHFSVPWQELRFATTGGYAIVPVREDSLPNFSFFDGDESLPTGPNTWRVSDFIDDIVEVRPLAEYGMVRDLIIDRSGRVSAVVLADESQLGRYDAFSAAPNSMQYDPVQNFHIIPRGRGEIANLGPFDASGLGAAVASR